MENNITGTKEEIHALNVSVSELSLLLYKAKTNLKSNLVAKKRQLEELSDEISSINDSLNVLDEHIKNAYLLDKALAMSNNLCVTDATSTFGKIFW